MRFPTSAGLAALVAGPCMSGAIIVAVPDISLIRHMAAFLLLFIAVVQTAVLVSSVTRCAACRGKTLDREST